MNKQRKVLITTTYNEMGIIIDTKAEELGSSAQPEIIRCNDCKYSHMTYDGECKYCDIWFPDEAEYMDGNYYCGSAERKEDEQN